MMSELIDKEVLIIIDNADFFMRGNRKNSFY